MEDINTSYSLSLSAGEPKLIPKNKFRFALLIQNETGYDIYVSASPSATTQGTKVPSGFAFEEPQFAGGEFYVYCASAVTSGLAVWEICRQ